MGILEILFPGEEAEVAVKLPMQDTSLPELRRSFRSGRTPSKRWWTEWSSAGPSS